MTDHQAALLETAYVLIADLDSLEAEEWLHDATFFDRPPIWMDVENLDDCPFCGESSLLHEKTRIGTGLWENDRIRCPECGELGDISISDEEANVDWDNEW